MVQPVLYICVITSFERSIQDATDECNEVMFQTVASTLAQLIYNWTSILFKHGLTDVLNGQKSILSCNYYYFSTLNNDKKTHLPSHGQEYMVCCGLGCGRSLAATRLIISHHFGGTSIYQMDKATYQCLLRWCCVFYDA